MKKIFYLSLLLFSSILYSQNTIDWEPEITVANGAVYGNLRPRISLLPNGAPIVLLGKSSNGQLHTIRWNGSEFDTPVSLLPSGMTAYVSSWNGADIAAHGDTVVVAFKANPLETGHVYIVRSVDGGLTFSDTIRADSHDTGVAWMPSMDIDNNGNPSVIYMAHDASWTNPRYVVSHSPDAGQSFEPEMEVAAAIPDEACDCCPAEYVIKDNNHVLLFRNNENNIRDIFGVFSSDGGVNYNETADVDNLNWSINACPATGPHGVFDNDKLFTVYASAASGKSRIYISETAINPSFSFSSRTMITPPMNINGLQNYPRITGKNDTLVVAWQENDASSTDVFCAFTTDGSISEILSTKHIVNENLSGTQGSPDVLYSNGLVHLIYQDALSGNVIYRKGMIGSLGLMSTKKNNVHIYPNPVSTNEFFVLHNVNDELTSLKITNSLGQEIDYLLSETEGNKIIRPFTQEMGIYFIELTFSNGTSIQEKIMIN